MSPAANRPAPQEVWDQLSQAERDAAYNNNAAVPTSAAWVAARDIAAAAFRAEAKAHLDLAGRRIRSSSVGQSEMFAALGATPVVIPFGETLAAVRSGVVECAVTGTLSANAIGLDQLTPFMHSMAITWGLSVFGANRAAWNGLPEWARTLIRQEVGTLERQIWDAVESEPSTVSPAMPACRVAPMDAVAKPPSYRFPPPTRVAASGC